jgi:AcrR family transcriptional regulator
MPRKLKMSQEDLPELVIDAAERLAAEDGLRGIVMRRIAVEVGVVPGSIYKFLGDLDEIVLRLNARTLSRLREHLRQSLNAEAEAGRNAVVLADAYLAFVMANRRVWGVILEHTMPGNRQVPDWYMAELSQTTGIVDAVLHPILPEAGERAHAVATLWAALHGLASLATSGKLAFVHPGDVREMGRILVARFLGLPTPTSLPVHGEHA